MGFIFFKFVLFKGDFKGYLLSQCLSYKGYCKSLMNLERIKMGYFDITKS
jgi:hypothetical protein